MRLAQSRRGKVSVARACREPEETRETWHCRRIGEGFEELKHTNTFFRSMSCRRMLENSVSDPRTGEHTHCIHLLYLSVSEAVVTAPG